jgi:hypothetical protein
MTDHDRLRGVPQGAEALPRMREVTQRDAALENHADSRMSRPRPHANTQNYWQPGVITVQ